jgi:hypothetical protein
MKFLTIPLIILVTAGCNSTTQLTTAKCDVFNLKPIPSRPSEIKASALSTKIYNDLEKVKPESGRRPTVKLDVKGLTLSEELYLGRKLVYSAGYDVIYTCSLDSTAHDFLVSGDFKNKNHKVEYNISIANKDAKLFSYKNI